MSAGPVTEPDTEPAVEPDIEPALPSSPEGAAARAAFAAEVSGVMGRPWELPGDGDDDLTAPDGAFWLARSRSRSGEVLGCVGARALPDGPVEVKRLWAAPAARGTGLGARLLGTVESWARERGARRVVLDTRSELEAAARLYRRCGWVEVAPYNANADAQLWFAKVLDGGTA